VNHDKKIEYIRRLGAGGMGEVWLANLKSTRDFQKLVAVKRIKPGAHSLDSVAGDRLLREAKLMSGLSHPNIVSVFDVLEEGGEILIVMEYLEGKTLKDVLGEGRLGTEQSLEILKQLLSAITYAHQNKVAHLDLSPHNIFLTDSGPLKVLDFGISRNIDDTSEQTITKDISGKLGYLPPEIFARGRFSTASDVWSIGVIAWEMSVGRRFISAENEFSRIKELSNLRQDSVQKKIDHAPEGYRAFLSAALRVNPSERMSAAELLKTLKVKTQKSNSLRSDSRFNWRWALVPISLFIISASISAYKRSAGFTRGVVKPSEPAVFLLSKPENHLVRFRDVPENSMSSAPFSDLACDSFCTKAFEGAVTDLGRKFVIENPPKATSYFHGLRYQNLDVALDQAVIRPCLKRPRCQVLSHAHSALRDFFKKLNSGSFKEYASGNEYWKALDVAGAPTLVSALKESWENTLSSEKQRDRLNFTRFADGFRNSSSADLVLFPEWKLHFFGFKLSDSDDVGRICIDIASSQVLAQVYSRFRQGVFPEVPKKTSFIIVITENPLVNLFNESPMIITINSGNNLNVPICRVELTNGLSRLRQYP